MMTTSHDKILSGEISSFQSHAGHGLKRAVFPFCKTEQGKGENMSGSRKALKVISIIMIVFAALTMALGLLMSLGLGLVAIPDASTASAGALVGLVGIGIIIGGAINLLIGILGVRGANNPAKIMPFFVLAIIGLVFGALGLIMNISQGTFEPSSLVSIALEIACVVLAFNVKKERDAGVIQ